MATTYNNLYMDIRQELHRAGIDAALGQGACHVLSIRPQGGVEMAVEEDA